MSLAQITLLGHQLAPADERRLHNLLTRLAHEQPLKSLEVMVLSPVVLLYLRAVESVNGTALALVPENLAGQPLRLPEGMVAVESPWDEARLREGIRTCYARQQSAGAILEGGAQAGLRIGQLLDGRFRVEAFLGRGACATVFRGLHHLSGLKVAIKLLDPHEVDRNPGALSELEREAKIMASVSHPNVVAILDAVLAPDAPAYLVMEHVDGETLGALVLREGALLPARAFALVADVARGLMAVHATGVVHCDVKPDNILIASNGQVRLADFGIARWEGSARREGWGGTPLYLAPEVMQKGAQRDHRADIYSLGCTLFYALTGRPPYVGDHTTHIMRRHLVDPVPDLYGRVPGLDERGAQCVKAMMAKDPRRRSSDLSALIDLFDALSRPA